MFVVYDDGVPLLPWNLKDNAGPLLHHVAPMPLKSLPPSIRTSGTPHHVMLIFHKKRKESGRTIEKAYNNSSSRLHQRSMGFRHPHRTWTSLSPICQASQNHMYMLLVGPDDNEHNLAHVRHVPPLHSLSTNKHQIKSETQFFSLSDAINSGVLNERPSPLCSSWLRQLDLANGKRNQWRTLF
ncbi:hypothetical protein D5086_031036 [Populus alba]|uniref:Uncharacterized protein n=1 Tax=Populus alba TaxID=43335 RepID=A0ACC4AQE3_POPAL